METPNELAQKISHSQLIRNKVTELIPEFQKFCLYSDYDIVVPVENEGLSILLPKLKDIHDKPRIIPSSVVERIDLDEFKNKKILIEDASTYSGYTLFKKRNWFIRQLPNTHVDVASLIIFNNYETRPEFAFQKYLRLTRNEYDWAREAIINYLASNAFMYYSDPPLWQFQFPQTKRIKLYDALSKISSFYSLPNYENSSWHRFALDNIKITNTNWLPSYIEIEDFTKIRLFINKFDSKIMVLPLFFPIIPPQMPLNLTEILDHASSFFPSEFDKVIEYSNEVANDPEFHFVWLSAIGSMLLLNDFYKQLEDLGVELEADDPFLIGPSPILGNYCCSAKLLKVFEEMMINMVKDKKHDNEIRLFPFDRYFSFIKSKDLKWFLSPTTSDLDAMLPERYMAAMVGKNIINSPDSPSTDFELINQNSISFPELKKEANRLTHSGINRALDVLVDEGILNPFIFTDQSAKVRRGYRIGGESKRSLLRTLGYAYEDFNF